jgi:hypothetical protein
MDQRLAKALVSALRHYLPERLWSRLYPMLSVFRRRASRLSYRRFWLRALLAGDHARRRKIATVLSVMPYSLVGWRGLEATYDAAVATRAHQPGSLVECGVAQGGCAALMGLVERDSGAARMLWLFDSFEGLPEPTAKDFVEGRTGSHIRPLTKGSCLGTLEQVSQLLFQRFGLDRNRITLVKGWFDTTLLVHRDAIGPIAVLRVDADWYASVRCCLDELYDRVVDGGYVIIDDYQSCFGAKKAVDEFLTSKGLAVTLVPDGRGGCHFVKPHRAPVHNVN